MGVEDIRELWQEYGHMVVGICLGGTIELAADGYDTWPAREYFEMLCGLGILSKTDGEHQIVFSGTITLVGDEAPIA